MFFPLFIDPRYLLFVMLPTLALTLLAQWWVKSAYNRASQIANMQRVTGAQAARRILDSAGLSYATIESTAPVPQTLRYGSLDGNPGGGSGATPQLDDHYAPSDKLLRLSPGVYGGTPRVERRRLHLRSGAGSLSVEPAVLGNARRRYGWSPA